MSTINKIFVDSSILIEALKGNKVSFFHNLISDINNVNYINDIIISEYLYYLIGFNTGSSPRTVQEKNQVHAVISESPNQIAILNDFRFLPGHSLLQNDVPKFMAAYNLLPNDAIILATCKIHNITKLASHDSDFIIPCKAEGIELLREE